MKLTPHTAREILARCNARPRDAHVGQHSGCDLGWYNTTRAAKPDEYAALKAELEGAPYGYRLKVYSRKQRWMDEKRRQTARKYK